MSEASKERVPIQYNATAVKVSTPWQNLNKYKNVFTAPFVRRIRFTQMPPQNRNYRQTDRVVSTSLVIGVPSQEEKDKQKFVASLQLLIELFSTH